MSGAARRVNVLRLLQAHGVRPDTDLGQHFLVDENLVDLSLRAGGVGPEDVVLEVGAGPGVLTAALARTARLVHAVELDRRMAPMLAEAVAGAGDVRLHWGDAMRLDLAALTPPPTRLVANLPYAIATPLVVESTWRLPSLRGWCVMVQREVADRWLASRGGPLYGAPSVLLQLCARPTFRRNVGREVFAPPPRVDSALVALERTGPGADGGLRALVRAAFAQRRKTLANTLGAAGADRDAVRAALASLDLPPTARAEDLGPDAFRRMAEELAWPG
ncbi:MAG TPA: 16S rRNA (adenine(1518)-N(6)/adenine(1519)-N(6))-dimethyltransferase RsmA [Egibacteraceae bacterium]|nr:16S rRNA (adenine(1518)-N(6)/adenine(1519)-N(6))-dimethyltransferase RsmA [Egibacteraceae bacterium]